MTQKNRSPVAIVTGATGGIGRAVVGALADNSYQIVAVDREVAALNDLIDGLPGGSARHLGVPSDISDLRQHAHYVELARDAFGRLDALVHLAAVLVRSHNIDDVTEDEWDLQMDTNLKATFFLNREVASEFRRLQCPGSIVNFTSEAWWTGGFGTAAVYAASKGGVVSLSRGLARIYARDGITINTVAPGAVDTPMLRGDLTPEDLQTQIEAIPIGRMASPEEIAGVVTFLTSPQARYITGATINATGGQLMY